MTEKLTRKERLANLRTAVYRFYDADGQLLYLGITHNIQQRWATHERIQPWWLDVVRREHSWCNTRAEAERTEAIATAKEKPLYDRSGQRTVGGPVDQRLAAEIERAMNAISDDVENGTYPLWSMLPGYGTLSEKYKVPPIGINQGLTKLAKPEGPLVYQQDQFAVSRPGCLPSRDAQRIGLLYFLASNAFGDSSFTHCDLMDTTAVSPGTAHRHLKRWLAADRMECLGSAPGRRAPVYRITRHPEPDPPQILQVWGRKDFQDLVQWLRGQLDVDADAQEQDRDILTACLPGEYAYGVSDVAVRVLKVIARRYRQRPGCRPEWGIL